MSIPRLGLITGAAPWSSLITNSTYEKNCGKQFMGGWWAILFWKRGGTGLLNSVKNAKMDIVYWLYPQVPR